MNSLKPAGDLADTLRKFNRKERYWVYREILGHEQEALLSHYFIERLKNRANGVPVPTARAWWATDFHFDWLLAAIYQHYTGQIECDFSDIASLIHGNQEDVDVLICEGSSLWLCEAKFSSKLNSDQVKSKKERVDRLVDLRNIIAKDLQFYLINMYPSGRYDPRAVSRDARSINYEICTHEKDSHVCDNFSTVTRTDRDRSGVYRKFRITTNIRVSK